MNVFVPELVDDEWFTVNKKYREHFHSMITGAEGLTVNADSRFMSFSLKDEYSHLKIFLEQQILYGFPADFDNLIMELSDVGKLYVKTDVESYNGRMKKVYHNLITNININGSNVLRFLTFKEDESLVSPSFEFYSWVDGELNDFDGEPAIITHNFAAHLKKGLLHNSKGHAFQGHLRSLKKISNEEWFKAGNNLNPIDEVLKSHPETVFANAYFTEGEFSENAGVNISVATRFYECNISYNNNNRTMINHYSNNIVEHYSSSGRHNLSAPAVELPNLKNEWWVGGAYIFSENINDDSGLWKKATNLYSMLNENCVPPFFDEILLDSHIKQTHLTEINIKQLNPIFTNPYINVSSFDSTSHEIFEQLKIKGFWIGEKVGQSTTKRIKIFIHYSSPESIIFTLGEETVLNSDNHILSWEEYSYCDGVLTNFDGKPAVNMSDGHIWVENGKLFNPDVAKPSIISLQNNIEFLKQLKIGIFNTNQIKPLMHNVSGFALWTDSLGSIRVEEPGICLASIMYSKNNETFNIHATGVNNYFIAVGEKSQKMMTLFNKHFEVA